MKLPHIVFGFMTLCHFIEFPPTILLFYHVLLSFCTITSKENIVTFVDVIDYTVRIVIFTFAATVLPTILPESLQALWLFNATDLLKVMKRDVPLLHVLHWGCLAYMYVLCVAITFEIYHKFFFELFLRKN